MCCALEGGFKYLSLGMDFKKTTLNKITFVIFGFYEIKKKVIVYSLQITFGGVKAEAWKGEKEFLQ